MEFTQDQIAAIIGMKELELVMLRLEVSKLRQKYEPLPANVEPIKKEVADA